jgi:hypothetical protein
MVLRLVRLVLMHIYIYIYSISCSLLEGKNNNKNEVRWAQASCETRPEKLRPPFYLLYIFFVFCETDDQKAVPFPFILNFGISPQRYFQIFKKIKITVLLIFEKSVTVTAKNDYLLRQATYRTATKQSPTTQ